MGWENKFADVIKRETKCRIKGEKRVKERKNEKLNQDAK